jgi:predicted site-specific integrase-resolvase
MKLSRLAQQAGMCYKTAWRWWKTGKIKGYQTETGTVVITEEISEQPGQERVVVIYVRVSANENRPNLDSQAERLAAYCGAKGCKVVKVVKEVGSGVNDGRKKLLALLADPTVTVIVVEHKDRLTRFGFKYIETLLAMQGRSIEVVNVTKNPIEDLIADFVSILYSFCAKRYGQRRAKRKTEKSVHELNVQAEQKAPQEVGEERAAS